MVVPADEESQNMLNSITNQLAGANAFLEFLNTQLTLVDRTGTLLAKLYALVFNDYPSTDDPFCMPTLGQHHFDKS